LLQLIIAAIFFHNAFNGNYQFCSKVFFILTFLFQSILLIKSHLESSLFILYNTIQMDTSHIPPTFHSYSHKQLLLITGIFSYTNVFINFMFLFFFFTVFFIILSPTLCLPISVPLKMLIMLRIKCSCKIMTVV